MAIEHSVQAPAQSYAIFSTLDVYDENLLKKLVGRYPDANMMSWLKPLGLIKKVKTTNSVWKYKEETPYFKASATIAGAENTGTTAVKITLSAGDHTDSGKKSFPRKTNTVYFLNGAQGLVTAVDRTSDNAHVVTVERLSSSHDVRTAAVVGSSVIFFSNAQPEASGEMETLIPGFTEYTARVQTIREKFKVTDHESQNKLDFQVNGQWYLHYRGLWETEQRFMRQFENMALIQDAGEVEVSDDDQTKKVYTTRGLIPEIKLYGKTVEYAGNPDYNTFEEVIKNIDKVHGESKYLVPMGLDAYLGIQHWAQQYIGDGNIDRFFGEKSGGSQALKVNFNHINIAGYDFALTGMKVLSDEESFGAAGMPFRDYLLFLPHGKTKNANPNFQADGEDSMEPYFQIRYSEPDGSPREKRGWYKIWETGGNAYTGATGDRLDRSVHFAAYPGVETRKKHMFFIAEKAG